MQTKSKWLMLIFGALLISRGGLSMEALDGGMAAFSSVKYPEIESDVLVVSNAGIEVVFMKGMAWTLHSIAFKGMVINPGQGTAASGTVISWYNHASGKKDWAGTGHGGEAVNDLVLMVDGQKYPVVADGADVYDRSTSIKGRSISLIKHSVIGPMKHEVVFDFPRTGGCYVVTHRYVFTEAVDTNRFSGGYTFMQMMPRSMNAWAVFTADGTSKTGVIDVAAIDAGEKARQTIVNFGAIKALACYSAELKTGVVYVYPMEYSGGNHLNQRPRQDIKFRASLIVGTSFNAGDALEFKMKVSPVAAEPETWLGHAAKLAAETDF